jgi:hypothetical protein
MTVILIRGDVWVVPVYELHESEVHAVHMLISSSVRRVLPFVRMRFTAELTCSA